MKRRQQTGIAMIEMVAVTPLLLLLLVAIGELGNAFLQYNMLNKSVREAAREVVRTALLGTTGNISLTDVLQAEGRNLVVYGNVAGLGQPRLPGLSTSHVIVDVEPAGDNLVLIQANYPYSPLLGPVLQTFGYGDNPSTSGITLTASVVMRAL
ncbi:MAG: pilus assembly protein [Gammaproteobacteria bacterium]|nr:pilus assembly protein [Gammaproteobacteria bacterium]